MLHTWSSRTGSTRLRWLTQHPIDVQRPRSRRGAAHWPADSCEPSWLSAFIADCDRLSWLFGRAHEARYPPLGNDGANGAYLGRAALNQLSEREGECRDASGEHDESECRDASRNQPEPSRSELPSQTE